ncbi:MAG: hypothetical protein DI585_04100 [Pseudomonas fluorescens]|nr:MAG: hypothetical protein DI585_04100 [Pseudomonas fluorescens]
MKTIIWSMGLWLLGIAPVAALDLRTPETLAYSVYWGPVKMGAAQLTYTPEKGRYTLRAEVKDNSSLIDLSDSWESRGVHTEKAPFRPEVYHVKQAENSYRADKTMTFDRAAKVVRYQNHIDATDEVEPLPLVDARDVLATVYTWRLRGDEEVMRGANVPMVSLKREITLKREAGVRETLKVGKRTLPVWKVQMRTIKGTKPSKDTWTVYLTDDAAMVPVRIVAATKFGTFRAELDQLPAVSNNTR